MYSFSRQNTQTKKLALLLILLAICTFARSQVSIGSLTPPVKSNLLELKNQEVQNPTSTTSADNITSTKGGLGLPRVALIDRTSLEPFISTTDSEWANASASKIKEKHIGLTVYNIYESTDLETDENKMFQEGTYVWDGQRWRLAFQGRRIFPCPAFNLLLPSVSAIGDPDMTYDLYQEYSQQFSKMGNTFFRSSNPTLETIANKNDEKLYLKNELDYVVTHYDESVLTITGIDANGMMSYRVKSVAPSSAAFINIIFMIKD